MFWTHFRGAAIIMSFFLEFFFHGIHVFRFDQFSLLMYCLLPSSATVKMDLYEENMEKACYATNDDTPL